jgi:hypothetical protein
LLPTLFLKISENDSKRFFYYRYQYISNNMFEINVGTDWLKTMLNYLDTEIHVRRRAFLHNSQDSSNLDSVFSLWDV